MKYDIITDYRGGYLLAINSFKDLQFTPKRIFSVFNVPINSIRGEHAHYKTEQLLICVQGKVEVGFDDCKNESKIILNPGESVYMKALTWGYQKFLTGNDYLLVLASSEYDKTDYITNKAQLRKIIN